MLVVVKYWCGFTSGLTKLVQEIRGDLEGPKDNNFVPKIPNFVFGFQSGT